MTTALLRSALRPALLGLLAAACLAAVLGGARALYADVLPSPGLWVAQVALAPLSVGTLLVPAALTIALVAPLARWRSEGAWSGARASGVGGRSLAAPAAMLGAVAAVLVGAASLEGEPAARRLGRDLVHRAVTGVALWPGRTARVGEVALHPLADGSAVLVDAGEALGVVRSVELVRTDAGPALELREGRLVAPELTLEFQRWVRPLPEPLPPRVELAQRSTAELARAVGRTRDAGGDASYEHAVLLKRFMHPLATLLLALALVPAGLGRRPWVHAATLGLAWLAAVRVGDHLAPVVGSWLAACTGPALVAGWAALLWARWRDR